MRLEVSDRSLAIACAAGFDCTVFSLDATVSLSEDDDDAFASSGLWAIPRRSMQHAATVGAGLAAAQHGLIVGAMCFRKVVYRIGMGKRAIDCIVEHGQLCITIRPNDVFLPPVTSADVNEVIRFGIPTFQSAK